MDLSAYTAPASESAFEKVPTHIFPSPTIACQLLASQVAGLIATRRAAGKHTVLGLATGSTPVPFYHELIRLHQQEGLSFHDVITFNLDEYFGLAPSHPESYARFMADQLFDHIDVPAENIHVPGGNIPLEEVVTHCQAYEKAIADAGGIDLQILGIGRTGHIGFNEPGSSRDSLTRRITLDRVTRQDAAADFLGEENVPRHAITMGVGTILAARQIVLMAWGENKAHMIRRAVEENPTEAVSASFLQGHPDAHFFLDPPAASQLVRVRTPWLVRPVRWDKDTTHRAVTWLASESSKPVLRLVDEEYGEGGMSDLVTEKGPAYQINIFTFNRLQNTITGWPGGKPDADDSFRPEKARPYPKRVLIFSPEPQDAILAMGSTIDRLVEQHHDVRLVCLTSGCLRVADEEAAKFARVLLEIGAEAPSGTWSQQSDYADQILSLLRSKGRFGDDPPAVRRLKGLVLRGEARDAARTLGLRPEQVIFLDLPFYETGRYRRFQPAPEDLDLTLKVLREFSPQQIFLTGAHADPSSLQAVTYKLACEALTEARRQQILVGELSAWHFRGKEQALEPHEIQMAVPMSPDQLENKRTALSRFQGLTTLELAVPDQNRATAQHYDRLGLAEYEAIESFQRPPDFG